MFGFLGQLLGQLGSGLGSLLQLGTQGVTALGSLAGQPGVAQLLGGLLGDQQTAARPQFFAPGITSLAPGQQAFFAAPEGSVVRQTPLLRVADQQARITAQLQRQFIRSTLMPQIRLQRQAAQQRQRQQQRLLRLVQRGRQESKPAQRLISSINATPQFNVNPAFIADPFGSLLGVPRLF